MSRTFPVTGYRLPVTRTGDWGLETGDWRLETSSRSPRRHLVFPGAPGQADQVLVELEPDRVVAVHSRRGDKGVVPGGDLRRGTRQPGGGVAEAGEAFGVGIEPGGGVGVQCCK